MLDSIQLLVGTTATESEWDLAEFLKNVETTLGEWFGLAVAVVGLVAIAYAIWQIVSGLMSQGKKQTNWAVAIILLLVGGTLTATGGFDFVQGIAQGGQETIEDLGTGGTIALYTKTMFLP